MPIYVFVMIGKETKAEIYLNITTSSTLPIFLQFCIFSTSSFYGAVCIFLFSIA